MLTSISRIALGLLLGAAIRTACAQEIPLRIGEPVPALHFPVVFQSGRPIPQKGHPLVVEYWATWCGPCIANIPHLNELANEFEKLGVDFLLPTDQSAEEVIPFLRKHPMTGMVVSDPGFSTNRLLKAPGLPSTLLVDSDGRLAAVTLPDRVTPQVLNALLKGDPLPLASLDRRVETEHILVSDVAAEDANAAVRVVVRAGSDGHPGTISSVNEFKGSSKLKELLRAAYQVAPQQIVLPENLDAVYSISAWVPLFNKAGVMPLVQSALTSAANLVVREEIKPMKVTVLRSFPGKVRSLEPNEPIALGDLIESARGRINSRGSVHAETLRKVVEQQIGEPVVLEDAHQGTFALDIHWDPNDKEGLRHAFQEAGMPLQEETRPTRVFIFSAAEDNRPRSIESE